jgi:hypothetical protein
MARLYSRRLVCILVIGCVLVAFHSYKNVQWIQFLSERQNILKSTTSRSLLPTSLSDEDRDPNDSVLSQTNSTILPAEDRRLCSRRQLMYGKWAPIELERPPYVSRYKHLRCYPDGDYEQSPWSTYAWEPNDKSCLISTWDSEDFCQKLQRATLSIIGDSLSWEHYSSLLQLLGQNVRQNDQHKSKSENRNHVQSACHERTRIVFRNDPRLEHITDSIRTDFPLVLVLNRGAHYVNDTTLLSNIRQNIVELQDWYETCTKMKLHCHLYWRTTVPGHPRCTFFNETVPVNEFPTMEERIHELANYGNQTINFHWYDFQRQNNLVLRELEASGLDYNIIDGYHLNILRPDEHRTHTGDCLHNCYPGKMDVYNQLLLHFLRMERSEEDVQTLLQQFDRARERFQQQRS